MEFEPLPLVSEERGGFKPLPLSTTTTEDSSFEPLPLQVVEKPAITKTMEEAPFEARHPNIYGAWGAAKETTKSLIPYLKYVDPDEREKFMKLSQQQQTRDLLLQNLEAVSLLAFDPLMKGVKPVVSETMKRWLPKTYKFLTTPIGKGGVETVLKETAPIAETVPEKPVAAPTAEPIPIPAPSEKAPKIAAGAKPEAVGGELPKYASSVNLERQAIEKDFKLTELRSAEEFPKKKVTWAETDIKSAEILKSPEEIATVFEKVKKGQALNVVETDVIRKANIEGLYDFQKEMQFAKTSDEANSIFQGYVERTFKPTSEAAGEAGRVLQSYNKEIGLTRLGKAFSKLEKGLGERELKEFKELDLDNPAQIKEFIGRLGDPKLMDYVYEFWYNSILSGVPTHVVNVANNTAWMAFQVPHRILTGGVDKLVSTFTGRARTRFIDEAIPMMAGVKTGFMRGAKPAIEMFKSGKVSNFETKWAQEMGSAVGAFDRSSNRVIRKVGEYITIPTKALRAMDVWANSMAYDAEAQALAIRAAKLKNLTGPAKDKFVKSFLENLPEAAHKEAMEFAKYATFMSDPGFFSSSIASLRDKVPGGRFIVPFVNTIGNLLKRGVEMTPGVGLVLSKGQNPSEVIAKQIEGAIISLYTLSKVDAGEITGAAPLNIAEREAFYRQGKKAWSIRLGDTWYQYRRIEPFNTAIAAAAIAYNRIKNAKSNDDAFDVFTNMASDFKNNLIDSSYLQGVTQLLNRYDKLKDFPKRTIPSLLVPYSGFFRSINRAYEAATEGSAKVRETDSWLGAFSTVIPGLSKTFPAKLTVWGEEVELEGGVFRQWLPFKWATEKKDLTETSLEKIGVYPGHPSQTIKINGKETKLDDDVYRNYLIAYGHKAKANLDKYFSQPHVQRAIEKEDKKEIISETVGSILSGLRDSFRHRAIKEQRLRTKN